MPAEQAPIPQLPEKQGRSKEPRARPPATAFSPHGLEENGTTKPRTGDKKTREKSRDLWAAYRTRRADLTRSGGEEDPEASAVERTADLRRIFRLFLAVEKGSAVERSEEREGGLGGDEVESRVWEVSTAPGKERRTGANTGGDPRDGNPRRAGDGVREGGLRSE